MQILSLLDLTIRDPKAAAEQVLSLDLSREFLWSALVLVTVVSVLLVKLMQAVLPQSEGALVLPFQNSPLLFALVMWGSLVLLVFSVHYIGQMFGGSGRFNQSILVVAWLQFLLLAWQVLQFFVGFVSIVVSALLGLAFMIYWIWIMASFVAVLHRFQNRVLVLVGMVVSLFGVMTCLSLVLSIVAVILGVELPDA